jgi:hypothetical protein
MAIQHDSWTESFHDKELQSYLNVYVSRIRFKLFPVVSFSKCRGGIMDCNVSAAKFLFRASAMLTLSTFHAWKRRDSFSKSTQGSQAQVSHNAFIFISVVLSSTSNTSQSKTAIMSAIHTLGIDQGVAPDPEKSIGNGPMRTAYQLHQSMDPTILFEEYLHYAKITRREEREAEKALKQKFSFKRLIKNRFSKGHTAPVLESAVRQPSGIDGEKNEETTVESGVPFDAFNNLTYSHPSHVSDAEWKALSRGVRTVGWSTCFYLITSDIIGPFGIPYVIPKARTLSNTDLLSAGLSHNSDTVLELHCSHFSDLPLACKISSYVKKTKTR